MDADTAVFAIVAFPSLEDSERQWIESIRAKHDPQARRIGAHFSLLFPTVLSRRVIEAQAARVAAATEPIKVVLHRAGVAPDSVAAGDHVFLMPDEGRDQITQLHDRLYEGALQAHLRKDLPFRPHMTIAARPTIDPLHLLAADINASTRNIRGFLAEIVLMEVTPTAIQPVAHFPLGALAAP
ncbi:MAG: 2'-5' RNA ligase family protein [Acidobacteria bacterium]|nr:2'-5' RNA ligase family protein [Acidobacteriota bacterium]